ncbi:MAG: protein-L-isoaspartate(D-aspartate) O-methyltransferase [Bacteroidales bacterium]|nr:protein-L-isoaspartate(D-aspartate) O-methyltransferase [Bacteroidales bacterium]
MEDTLKDQGARARLVRELQQEGITDAAVLHAFATVPRHFFVPEFLRDHAYGGNALPIACGQTISQPFTVAYQSQLLEVRPKQKILEIGTGSGFQAAVLHAMGAHVYSVERQYDLYKEAEARFQRLRIRVAHKHGDGYLGWREFAPYDRILVTCAAPVVPEALLRQLKIGGALLVPLGEEEQRMTRIVRSGEDSFERSEYGSFQFVPMLRNKTSHVKK